MDPIMSNACSHCVPYLNSTAGINRKLETAVNQEVISTFKKRTTKYGVNNIESLLYFNSF